MLTPENMPSGDTPNGLRESPVSILPLAPKSVKLLAKGQPLKISKGRYSIAAGRPFQMIVEPQSPNDQVDITSDSFLQQASSAHKIFTGTGVAYEALFVPKLTWKTIPYATIGRIRLSVSREGLPPRRMSFAIHVKPSWKIYLCWVLGIFLFLAAERLRRYVFDASSIQEFLTDIREEIPILFSRLGLSSLILIPVYLIGLIFTATTDNDEDI